MYIPLLAMLWLSLLLFFPSVVSSQQCGPLGPSGPAAALKCAPKLCCSQYGWCGTTAAYCDPGSCQAAFSGDESACTSRSTLARSSSKATSTSTTSPYASKIPDIDTCGGSAKVRCPGAGTGGYFYRCCSSYGHCGPKNELQDQRLYCGSGCQSAWGNCQTNRAVPPDPTASPGIADKGQTCGPIVNRRCAAGLCCSGSNYCGTGDAYCGKANWCQPKYGTCS